ncbi:hypothetical protein ACJX0J_028229, partial [Zea mays]
MTGEYCKAHHIRFRIEIINNPITKSPTAVQLGKNSMHINLQLTLYSVDFIKKLIG